MSANKQFTKENLDTYLKELAKEFRKRNGNKMPAEIILIGGASVLINYGFREMTYDVVGILIEQEDRGEPLTFEIIKNAIEDLYDSYEAVPENSRRFIEAIYEKEDLKEFYKQCREMELENKDILVEFQDDYPGVLNGDNLADILKAAREKKNKES